MYLDARRRVGHLGAVEKNVGQGVDGVLQLENQLAFENIQVHLPAEFLKPNALNHLVEALLQVQAVDDAGVRLLAPNALEALLL